MKNQYIYRFAVKNKRDKEVIGTGILTSDVELDEQQRISLFHSVTHNKYIDMEMYFDVSISKEKQYSTLF